VLQPHGGEVPRGHEYSEQSSAASEDLSGVVVKYTQSSTSPQLVILTGLSGSGKGSVLRTFEDLGYYCVDNLPVLLIPGFTKFFAQERRDIKRAALLVDAREGSNLRGYQRFTAS